jgi:hypothetical protein
VVLAPKLPQITSGQQVIDTYNTQNWASIWAEEDADEDFSETLRMLVLVAIPQKNNPLKSLIPAWNGIMGDDVVTAISDPSQKLGQKSACITSNLH